jgi:hypothetical protein
MVVGDWLVRITSELPCPGCGTKQRPVDIEATAAGWRLVCRCGVDIIDSEPRFQLDVDDDVS